MGGGKPLHRRVEARPAEDQDARRDEGESKGGAKYAFDFGGGVETIVADGSDQPGYGGTLLSVKAEAPDSWVVERKQDSRLLLKATWKLSKDGRILTDYFRQFGADGSTFSPRWPMFSS